MEMDHVEDRTDKSRLHCCFFSCTLSYSLIRTHHLHRVHHSGGFRRGASSAPPLRPKIFSISCSFSENLTKSYVGAPTPEGRRPLLQGILDPPLHQVQNCSFSIIVFGVKHSTTISCSVTAGMIIVILCRR